MPPLVDPITLDVSGAQYEAFVEALVDAFPGYDALAMMTRFRLELALARVAGPGGPLDDVALKLVEDQKSRGHFLRLLEAARASRPGNPKLAFFAEQFDLSAQTKPRPELERVIRDTNSFLPITEWRERLAEIEGRVCRIEVKANAGTGYGTGFLVGDDLVLTNYHVVEAVIAGERNEYTASGLRATLDDVVLRFDYRETRGGVSMGSEARLAAIVDYSEYSPADFESPPKSAEAAVDRLDHALLRLRPGPRGKAFGTQPIGDRPERDAPARGTIALPPADWPFQPGSPLFIVQHPDGAPLKVVLDTSGVLAMNGSSTRVTYTTNTLGGSSGSPCFNQHLELVALHHAGDPKYAPMYFPSFNEGIPIAAVRKRLAAKGVTGLAIA